MGVRDVLSKCYEVYGVWYFVALICCAILAILLLFSGRERVWISNMPEDYMVVGRSFTTDLSLDEIEKISEDYFADKNVYDFRISKFKKKGMYMLSDRVEGVNRDFRLGNIQTKGLFTQKIAEANMEKQNSGQKEER